MKPLFTLHLLILLIAPLALKAQFNHLWSQAIGGNGYDLGHDVAVDDNGNIFVTGSFRDTADFDPTSSTYHLISKGAADGYLARYLPNGDLVWAHSFGSPGMYAATTNDVTKAIAADVAGNVYIGINFGGLHPFGIVDTMDIDPGPDIVPIVNAGINNGILVKFDVQGNFIWAIHLAATGVSDIGSISLDTSGNVYAIGTFRGTVDFDTGPDALNITSVGGNDIFVMKYSSSGDLIWVRTMGGLADEGGYDIARNTSGDLFITGNFKGTVDFDPGSGVAELIGDPTLFDVFFAKYDADGNYLWAHAINPAGLDVPCGVVSDAEGNVMVSGVFNDVFDFDPGTGVASLVANGGRDIFIAKYSGEGNFIWAKSIGASEYETPNDLVSDGEGGFYITGAFNGTVDFNPGGTSMPLTSNGAGDIFFARFNGDGVCLGTGHAGGLSTDFGMGITKVATDNILVTGYFGGVADFDPGAGVVHLTSSGTADIFMAQYEWGGPLPVALISFTAHCISNAVHLEWATATEQNNAGFEIEKSHDGNKFEKIAFMDGTGYSNSEHRYTYTDSDPGAPNIFYRLKQIDKDGKSQYSSIVSIPCGYEKALKVYPNPVSTDLNLEFDRRINNGVLKITDVAGAERYRIAISVAPGDKIKIKTAALLPGVYFLQLQHGDMTNMESVKFIKIK